MLSGLCGYGVHVREVDPHERRLTGLVCSLDKLCGPVRDSSSIRPSALSSAGRVSADLLADLAEARIDRGSSLSDACSPSPARSELGTKLGALWIVGQFGLFLGVQM